MDIQARNTRSIASKPLLLAAVLLGILALTSLACSLGGVTLNGNTALIDVSLKQDQVNQIFQSVTTQTDTNTMLLKKVTGVEMHPGVVRVLGTYDKSDGTEANGSYDVAMSAENNALQAKITAVNMEGVDMNDPRVVTANQKLSEALSESVTKSNGEVLFKEVNVVEGAMNLKIQVNFRGTPNP